MYQVPDMNLWKGRINPHHSDLLLHQIVKPLDLSNGLITGTAPAVALLGFMCDEGVRRNFGRTGAVNGPNEIRKASTGLSVPFAVDKMNVYDAGNVICTNEHLEAAFLHLIKKTTKLLSQGMFPILLGGGHETAYPHFKAIRDHVDTDKRIGIINFDAHFDMRTYENGPHSGSSFRHIMDDELEAGRTFHYLPIGIRPASNTPSLFEVMRAHRQTYILLEEVQQDFARVLDKITAFSSTVDYLYLSIDLDCFPSAYAPGVSAAAPDGMLPGDLRRMLKLLIQTQKVVSIDLVEVNPDFDIDDRTARLAALLLYDCLSCISGICTHQSSIT